MVPTSVRTNGFCLPTGVVGAIAITGGAPSQSSEEVDAILHQTIHDVVGSLVGQGLAILCNGTKWGVPLWATEAAIELGLPLVRVYPQKASKYLSDYEVRFNLMVLPRCGESEWGDDSEVMVKLASGIIFVGGGTGTLIEFAHWAKINESRVKYKQPLIYGVPLAGTGGVADMVYSSLRSLWQDKIATCLPEEPISSGVLAAKFLLERVGKR